MCNSKVFRVNYRIINVKFLVYCENVLRNRYLSTRLPASEERILVRTLFPQTRLWFYRTRSGMEIDLLCETGSGILGMEIKSSTAVSGSNFRGLRHPGSALRKRWIGGIVIYRGDKIWQCEPDMWAIPSYRLLTP